MKFETKYLSDVVFFQEGPGVRKFQFRNEGVKLLNVGNINKGKLTTSTTKLFISKEEANGKYKHFLVDEGDLLIASSGIVVDNFHNKIAYAKKEDLPLCLNTSTIRFKSLDKKVFCLDYLKFYLKTNHFKNQLRKLITGAAQLNFGPSHLKKILLPVPNNIADQIQIAKLLSKAENLIDQRKESIALLEEFLKSTFLQIFGDPVRNEKGWKICSLADFGSLKNGLNYTKNESGQSIKCLGVGDFKNFYRLTDIESLTTLSLTSLPTQEYLLKNGDLIFVRSNGNKELIGRCLVIYPENTTVTFSGFCIRYRPYDDSVNTMYLSHLFRIPIFKTVMLQGGKGANIQNINQSMLEGLKIPAPPIELQNHFAQIVEKTEALKTQYQQSLRELENLYGSLSQRAFKGELKMTQPKEIA